MANTNFGALTSPEKVAWSRTTWKVARNSSFVMQFAGTGANSPFQRITELTKSERGAKAIVQLIPDLTGDGVMGDVTLKGKEEAMKLFKQEVLIDQLRNANMNTGRMDDQKAVVNFRENSKDLLGYWLGDRIDQLAFLTMSGIAYTGTNNGALRPVLAAGQNFSDLSYAASVAAPSTNRGFRWDASTGLEAADLTVMAAADTLTYAALVNLKAQAKSNYVKGIKGPGNQEFYHVFVHPLAMVHLKLDPDFKNAVNNAGVRGSKNPVFTGSMPTVDGLIIHEHRHVFNTTKAAATTGVGDEGVLGYKWGAHGANTDGCRVLLVGAQALAMGDLGTPYWDEEDEDYNNQYGISVGKIFGMLKPKFDVLADGNVEDFGVCTLDVAI